MAGLAPAGLPKNPNLNPKKLQAPAPAGDRESSRQNQMAKRLGTYGRWGRRARRTGALRQFLKGNGRMNRVSDDHRRLKVVPKPPVRHPSQMSDEDHAFPAPAPLAPRPAVSEAMASCPQCGCSIVIVLEAQS